MILLLPGAEAVTPRWEWVSSFDNVNDGDWYRDQYDDWGPYLAGSENYVMKSLAAMYRTTGDPTYLDELIWHADGVLAQRNDARGVTDFTGVETPCWRDMYYSGGRPFCWVLHDGLILEPIVDLARLVYADGLEAEIAYDGATFGEKAAAYVAAAEETVAFHDLEWNDGGWYIIRGDATFLGSEANNPYPLNCSNAMGTTLVLLHDVTGEEAYYEKVVALAGYFHDNLVRRTDGAYAWPYYGDDVVEAGEDISHASVSVRFAAWCHERGIVFSDADMAAFAQTLQSVTLDDRTFARTLVPDPDDTNYLDYEASTYEWLPLTTIQPATWTVVRNLYSLSYPAEDNTSGSRLEGWAMLAEHEPRACVPTLPGEDWSVDGEGWRAATVAAPRLAVVTDEACVVPLEVDAPALTLTIGEGTIARWQATGGPLVRWVPIPAGGGTVVLTAETGTVRVRPPRDPVTTTIIGAPPDPAAAGVPSTWTAEGEGQAPTWWSLAEFPTGARMDPATGVVTWTPPAEGEWPFVVRLEDDYGEATLAFDWCVGECPEPAETGDTAAPDSPPGDSGAPDSGGDEESRPAPEPAPTPCGCGGGAAGVLLAGPGWIVARRIRSRAGGSAPGRVAGIRGLLRALGLALLASCAAPKLTLPDSSPGPEPSDSSHSDSSASADSPDSPADTSPDSDPGDSAPPDSDGDGSSDAEDCAPDDPAIGPGRADVCDGADVDCDGEIDEDCAISVATGQSHSCALLLDGRIACWGADSNGQTDAPAGVFVAIDAGIHHTCAIDPDGAATCWGEDGDGQLDVPTGTWTAVSAGWRASAGVADGVVHAWGSPYQGVTATPSGTWSDVSCGRYHCCATDDAGVGTCWGYWGLNTVPADTSFRSIRAGYTHTCGIRADETLTCWGYGEDGRLEPPEGSFTAVDCGATHCCALDGDGAVSCWGGDEAGQTEAPEGAYTAIAAGGYHTCAVTTDGAVVCWGNDAQGQVSVPAGFD